jgi:hypothetical protein
MVVHTKMHKDITLFFDGKSSLLVKVEHKVADSSLQEVKEDR